MEAEIRPDPTPEERAAILAVLERMTSGEGGSRASRSAWRELGVRENVEEDETETGA